MTAIDIQELTKRYDTVNVVDKLSLTVPEGDCLALLGPNGAGKTTTIKMLCGLIKPTAGTILMNGQSIQHRRATMQKLGVVLEGARNVYWRLSSWENLLYFAHIKGVRVNHLTKARMEMLLRNLDLWERRHDEVRKFSRGMQQKVAIACALVADPDIVLLDEPTLGLDAQAYQAIVKFVRVLAAEGKTVILTSHDFGFIRDVAERVVVMQRRILYDGTVRDLARLHSGAYTIRVRNFPYGHESYFADWRVQHHEQVTSLSGDGDVYRLVSRLASLGCILESVEPAQLTAELFLDLLERA